jgi:hypothetical protein
MDKYVTLAYDPTWKALDWAKQNCPSYITNDFHMCHNDYDRSKIDYFFGSEQDVVLFKLRWA